MNRKFNAKLLSLIICRGFTPSEFTNIYCNKKQVETIIKDDRVRAVKFTGGTPAGTYVAKLCGKYMKKGTFELTGNDPFLVLQEANIHTAAVAAYKSRMACNAQTGFAAKRIIVEECVYDEFKDTLIDIIKRRTKIGDPLNEDCNFGPLAYPGAM